MASINSLYGVSQVYSVVSFRLSRALETLEQLVFSGYSSTSDTNEPDIQPQLIVYQTSFSPAPPFRAALSCQNLVLIRYSFTGYGIIELQEEQRVLIIGKCGIICALYLPCNY